MKTVVMLCLAACGAPASHQQPNVDAPPPHLVDAPNTSSFQDAPATASGTDPATDGTFAVTEATASIPGATADHTLPATIYTPTGVTAPALVVISPGFQMARTQYATYAHHLATWGFEVILTDYADQGFSADHQMMANDVGAVINYALKPGFTPAIDAAKIALAGHSLGGDVSVLAAAGDARVKAVVGWDPVDGSPSVVPEHMTGLTAKLAVIGETTDGSGSFACSPTGDNYVAFYAAAPAPAVAMTINGADHMDWVDDGTCILCGLCTAGTASPDLAHGATRRLNVTWLRTQLFGDTSMQAWLMAPPEITAGTATIVHK